MSDLYCERLFCNSIQIRGNRGAQLNFQLSLLFDPTATTSQTYPVSIDEGNGEDNVFFVNSIHLIRRETVATAGAMLISVGKSAAAPTSFVADYSYTIAGTQYDMDTITGVDGMGTENIHVSIPELYAGAGAVRFVVNGFRLGKNEI
jgi:hypothetical protein